MKCPNCGSNQSDTDTRCTACGHPLEKIKPVKKESKLITAVKSLLTVALVILVFFGVQIAVANAYWYLCELNMVFDGTLAFPIDKTSPEYAQAAVEINEKVVSNSILISLVSNLLVILILCLSYTVRHKSPLNGMNIKAVSPMRHVGFAIFGMALQVFIAVTMAFIPIPEWMIEAHNSQYDTIASGNNVILEILSVGVVTGIVEELIFRGIGTKQLKRFLPPAAAVVVSAVIFGLVHPTALSMIYATVLGLILGALYVKYDSVIPSIICHVFFNSTSSLLALIPEEAAVILLVLYGVSIPALIYFTKSMFFRYPNVSDLLFDDKGRIKPRNCREAAVISEMNALKESGEITEKDYKRLEHDWNEAKKPLPPQSGSENNCTETNENDSQNKGDSNEAL